MSDEPEPEPCEVPCEELLADCQQIVELQREKIRRLERALRENGIKGF